MQETGEGLLDRIGGVILELHRVSAALAADAFQDAAFERVKSVVPFDSAGWMTGSLAPGAAAGFDALHLHRQPQQLIADWRRTRDGTAFFQRVLASPGTTLSCAVARDMGAELAAHCRRYGVEHILATAVVDPVTSLHETIFLWRADAGRPFSEAERAMQQALAPHLAETWRASRLLQATCAVGRGPAQVYQAAAADAQGLLHLIEPGFNRLLQCEWPGWRGPRLPDGLIAAFEGGSGRFVGAKIVVALSTLHNQYLLRGREKSAVDALRPNKLAVAVHFANGRTHKEIAALLGLAPATVRNYLGSIYGTLGVSSKAELANMLRGYS